VATISRLRKIIRLFCRRALQNRRYSAKETYHFNEPTNRSHSVHNLCDESKGVYTICNTLQHTATHCNTLQHTATHCKRSVYNVYDELNTNSTHCCSVLQCVAVCCSVLQCVAVCCSVSRVMNTNSTHNTASQPYTQHGITRGESNAVSYIQFSFCCVKLWGCCVYITRHHIMILMQYCTAIFLISLCLQHGITRRVCCCIV